MARKEERAMVPTKKKHKRCVLFTDKSKTVFEEIAMTDFYKKAKKKAHDIVSKVKESSQKPLEDVRDVSETIKEVTVESTKKVAQKASEKLSDVCNKTCSTGPINEVVDKIREKRIKRIKKEIEKVSEELCSCTEKAQHLVLASKLAALKLKLYKLTGE